MEVGRRPSWGTVPPQACRDWGLLTEKWGPALGRGGSSGNAVAVAVSTQRDGSGLSNLSAGGMTLEGHLRGERCQPRERPQEVTLPRPQEAVPG